MSRIPFSEDEFRVIGEHYIGSAVVFKRNVNKDAPAYEPIYNRPITAKENFRLFYTTRKPYWIPSTGWGACDMNQFRPRILLENVVNHIVCDGEDPIEYTDLVMKSDWFDLEWEFVPVTGGATVRPGFQKVPDMSHWEDYISIPSLDQLDFEDSARKNARFLDTPQLNTLSGVAGPWERLISLMDVADAAMALIDEDQQEGVKRFFDQYTDMIIDYYRRTKATCPIDAINIHDDWGHQNGPFFSLDTAREMLVPYLKKLTDAAHEMGLFFDLHSCGKNERLDPAYIEAGVDSWSPQPINDVYMLAEQYKDAPIAFGVQSIPLPENASETQLREAADEWFETYGHLHLMTSLRNPNPVFMNELYKVSRIAFSKYED